MALGKRRRSRRASAPKRRRMMKRKIARRAIRDKIMLKRTNYSGSWSFSSVSTAGFWQYLTVTPAANFNNFAEFAATFDEFKVNALKITFRPRYDNISAADAAAGNIEAYAHYCIDPGSTSLPTGSYNQTTLNSFLENDRVKTKTLNKPFSIYFKPKVSMNLLGGGTATKVIRPGWVKTTETSTQFRGVHVFLQQNNVANTNTNIVLDVFYTWYISFKNPK